MTLRARDTLLPVAALLIAGAFARPPAGTFAQSTPPPARTADPIDIIDPTDPDCDENEVEAARVAAERRSRTITRRPAHRHVYTKNIGGNGRGLKINDDLIERALIVAREINPATARRLRELRERDPVAFQASMATTGRRLIALAELKRRNKKLYQFKITEIEFEQRVKHTANRLRRARAEFEEGKRSLSYVDNIEGQLRGELRILVALSIPHRAMYLKELEAHIEKLRAEIDFAARNIEQTVDERYEQLMGADNPPS